MNKAQAQGLKILEAKLHDSVLALADTKVGTAAEKSLRRAVEDYQKLIASYRPGTPHPNQNIPSRAKGGSDGFKSLI